MSTQYKELQSLIKRKLEEMKLVFKTIGQMKSEKNIGGIRAVAEMRVKMLCNFGNLLLATGSKKLEQYSSSFDEIEMCLCHTENIVTSESVADAMIEFMRVDQLIKAQAAISFMNN